MTGLFFSMSNAGVSKIVALSLILIGLLLLLLLFRRADLRALRRSRSSNDAADLRAALNELASAAHELQRVSRRADGPLLAVAERGTIASLRRTASALSIVSEGMKLRVPFKGSDRGVPPPAALRADAKTS